MVRILFIALVNFCIVMFATTAYSNILDLDEQECRPELIKKPTKKGMKVVGELSGFDPCHQSVTIKISQGGVNNQLFISIHGGGGKKDSTAITDEFYKMGFSTLIFDAFEMNGIYGSSPIGNSSRQKMLFRITSQAYDWVVQNPKLNPDSIYIYGVSNGASVALNLASIVSGDNVKGVIAEAPTPVGIGYPNTISVPALIVFGKLDDFAAPKGKKRWEVSDPCRFVSFFSEAPIGTAKTCSKKTPNGKMLTTIEWVNRVKFKDKGSIEVEYIDDVAHAGFYGPLTIETRADRFRRRNLPVKPFMENQGWSTGGGAKGRQALLTSISNFVGQ